jgi:hypothetical protein
LALGYVLAVTFELVCTLGYPLRGRRVTWLTYCIT